MEEIQSRNKGRVKEALVKLRQFFKIDSTEGAKEEVGFEADEKFHVVPIVPSGCRFYKANENSIANRYVSVRHSWMFFSSWTHCAVQQVF